jgi:hypothetical protein
MIGGRKVEWSSERHRKEEWCNSSGGNGGGSKELWTGARNRMVGERAMAVNLIGPTGM